MTSLIALSELIAQIAIYKTDLIQIFQSAEVSVTEVNSSFGPTR